jgi:hypothetical protein
MVAFYDKAPCSVVKVDDISQARTASIFREMMDGALLQLDCTAL